MAKLTVSFPHISRLFSALLWILLTSLIVTNLYGKLTLQPNTLNTLPLLLQPFSSEEHMRYAQLLWTSGHTNNAKHEVHLADVLGASDKSKDTLNALKQEPILLQNKYDYWVQSVRKYPDFADAYLLAAIAAYQLGKTPEAKKLMNEALKINPVSPSILEFSAFMQ